MPEEDEAIELLEFPLTIGFDRALDFSRKGLLAGFWVIFGEGRSGLADRMEIPESE